MLNGQKDKITVLTMRQFDAEDENIVMRDNRIEKIRILNRETGEMEEYTGSVFLDATYEGDLRAAAGVPFRVGREGKTSSASPEPGASTNIGAVGRGRQHVQERQCRAVLQLPPLSDQ